MRSRTADHLYWMVALHRTGRALARLVDRHYRNVHFYPMPAPPDPVLEAPLNRLEWKHALQGETMPSNPKNRFAFVSLEATIAAVSSALAVAARNSPRPARIVTSSSGRPSTQLDGSEIPSPRSAPSRPDIGQLVSKWVKERPLTRGVTSAH